MDRFLQETGGAAAVVIVVGFVERLWRGTRRPHLAALIGALTFLVLRAQDREWFEYNGWPRVQVACAGGVLALVFFESRDRVHYKNAARSVDMIHEKAKVLEALARQRTKVVTEGGLDAGLLKKQPVPDGSVPYLVRVKELCGAACR